MRESRNRWPWLLLLLTAAARADAPPPAEFWDYYGEFGDSEGELFDPLDLGDAEAAAQQARVQQPLFGGRRKTDPALDAIEPDVTESEESTP